MFGLFQMFEKVRAHLVILGATFELRIGFSGGGQWGI